MEQQIKIPISNQRYILGILRGSLKNPLIVFVHGLGGSMNEHQFFNGARYVEKHGFASFRFDLYGWEKNQRKLHECTLKVHAGDLDRVIQYLRGKGAKEIYVVGHSYGGKTILMSKNKDFEGVALWDPSHNAYPLFRKGHHLKNPRGFLDLEGSYGIFIGESMQKEEKKFPWKERIKAIRVPVRFICAEKGVLVRGCKQYYAAANNPKSLVIIKRATHCFDEEGTEEKLFHETVSWFKKRN